jgi:hypothetical protein
VLARLVVVQHDARAVALFDRIEPSPTIALQRVVVEALPRYGVQLSSAGVT